MTKATEKDAKINPIDIPIIDSNCEAIRSTDIKVANSVKGYNNEIFAPQYLHLPLSNI